MSEAASDIRADDATDGPITSHHRSCYEAISKDSPTKHLYAIQLRSTSFKFFHPQLFLADTLIYIYVIKSPLFRWSAQYFSQSSVFLLLLQISIYKIVYEWMFLILIDKK